MYFTNLNLQINRVNLLQDEGQEGQRERRAERAARGLERGREKRAEEDR